jgi:N-acetyl-alpha-D-muramate 1-phosphate uridylyltransferase
MTTVAILAGGLATRLRPLTEKFPKALIDIHGKPFIEYQLELICQQGFQDVVLCVGYEGKQIEDYIRSNIKLGLSIQFSYDGDTLLGTGGSIKKAFPLLSDPFIVLYGDSYLLADYQSILQRFLSDTQHTALMTVYENADLYDKSNVVFEKEKLVRYDKKSKTSAMRHIDWGLGIIKKAALEGYNTLPFDLAELYTNLSKQQKLMGVEIFQRFYEIGSYTGIEEFKKFVKEKG